MKKNVLITLLAASATGTAFANVNVTGSISDWSFAGVPGEGAVLGKLNLLVPNLAGGTASQTISGLPQGKYILSWDEATAKNVKVTAAGQAVKNNVPFDFDGNGGLEITIGPADEGTNGGGYQIDNISLELYCDLEQFRADLINNIVAAGDTFDTLNANVTDEDLIKEYADRKAAILKELDTLKATAEKLPDDKDVTLKEYVDNKYWDLTENHALYQELKGIEDEIETYNGDVTLVNAKADLVVKAVAAKDAAESKLDGLADNAVVADLLEGISDNAQSEWIVAQINKDLEKYKTAQETVSAEVLALAAVNANDANSLEAVAKVDKALDEQIKAVDKSIDEFAVELGKFKTTLQGVITMANHYNAIYVDKGSADVPGVNYLDETVKNARKELFQLDGVYGAIQQQANVEIDKIAKEAKESLKTEEGNVDSATEENYNADQTTLKDAIAKINAEVAKALATMDGPFGAIATQIQALEASMEPTDNIRPSDAEAIAAQKAVIDSKLADLQSKAEAAYAEGTLTDGKFDTEIADIKKLIATYNNDVVASNAVAAVIAANLKLLEDAQKELTSTWSGWEATEKKEFNDHQDWWITNNSQFMQSYKTIVDFIDEQIKLNKAAKTSTDKVTALKKGEGVMQTIDDSKKSLSDVGQMIIDEIVNVGKVNVTCTAYANAIGDILTNKEAYTKDAKKQYEDALKAIKENLGKMEDALSNAVSNQESGQQIYEEVLKVKDEYGKVDFNGDLNEVLTNLEIGLTTANKQYVADALAADLAKLPDGSVVPGKANTVKLINDFTADINKVTVPDVTANITKVGDIATYAAKFNTADADIAAVKAFIPQVDAAVNACVTNYNNYQANVTAIDGLTQSVEEIRADVQNYEAHDAYGKLLDAEQAKINTLATNNTKEYKKFQVKYERKDPVYDKDGKVTEEGKITITPGTPMQTGLKGDIDKEKTSINNVKKQIEKNEQDYQVLVDKSIDLGLVLNDYLEVLNANISSNSDVDAPQEMEKILRALYSYNSTINKAYNALFDKSVATVAVIEAQLIAWREDADRIMEDLDDEVCKYNTYVFNSSWNGDEAEYGYNVVYGTYTSTVRDFDKYNSVDNPGFLAYSYNGQKVSDLFDNTHAALFEYYDLIRQLNNDANALLSSLNKQKVTITDQFDHGTTVVKDKDGKIITGFCTQADEYIKAIEKKFNDFTTEINAAAEAYYQYLSQQKKDMLADAQSKLVTDAGVEEADAKLALADLQSYFDSAVDTYNTVQDAIAEGEPDELAMVIGDICSYLDKINKVSVNAVTNPLALAAWKEAYEAALEEAAVDFTECPGIDTKSYDAIIAKIEALNEKALEYSGKNELLDNLASLKQQLESLAEAAKEEGENLVQNWHPTNQQLYDDFMTKGYPDLQNLYTALKNAVLPLASAPDEIDTLNSIEAQIEALKDRVEKAGVNGVVNALGTNKSYSDSYRYKNIVTRIDMEYKEAYTNALNYLQSNVDAVKTGFNSAIADGKVPENVDKDDLWDGIEALSQQIAKMLNETATAEIAKKNIAEVLEMQEKLAAYQVQLDGYLDNDRVSGVVVALNEAYDKVDAALTDLQSALEVSEDEVKEAYTAQVEALANDLAEIKSKINADDPGIIYQQANITDQLNRVAEQISDLDSDIKDANDAAKAAQAKAAENQRIYDELIVYPQYIDDAVNLLEEEAKEFSFNADSTIDSYRSNAELKRTQVTEAYEDVDLPDWSADFIDSWKLNVDNQLININCYRANTTYNYTTYAYNNAQSIVVTVTRNVQNFNSRYPGMAGRFDGDLADLVTAVAELEQAQSYTGEYTTADVTAYINGLKEIYTQAKAIYAEANALIDLINLNSVVLGDVNLDGQVTISDVSKLLNWVLDNTQFDDNNKSHIAADINGNGRLDTSDIQSILNILFGSANRAQAMQRMAPAAANISVAAERVAVANGAQRFDISLANDIKLVGGMVDIVLAEGMEITSLMPSERLEGLEFYTKDLGEGVTRVLFINTGEPRNIAGTDGAIFNVEVSGNGNVSLENIEFTNAQAHLYSVANVGNTSAIEGIWNDFKAFGRRIYNAGGQMLERLQRGINIVTNSDGTSSKILKK